jgi:hypothetical protein
MEAMLGISLNSYPYLNEQKCFVFLIIVYVFSLTKLEVRRVGRRERGRGRGEK